MAVEVVRAKQKVQPLSEVVITSAAWPSRNVKLILHEKDRFGKVEGPSLSLHTDFGPSTTISVNSFGAGACYTLKEAQEIAAAFNEAVEYLSSL